MRKKINPGAKVNLAFSTRERELVLDHTFAGSELTGVLEVSVAVRGKHVVAYTLDDLDELLGYIAAEANHATNRKVQVELDTLHERVQQLMESYDDGNFNRDS